LIVLVAVSEIGQLLTSSTSQIKFHKKCTVQRQIDKSFTKLYPFVKNVGIAPMKLNYSDIGLSWQNIKETLLRSNEIFRH